jgi:hypothetical protein
VAFFTSSFLQAAGVPPGSSVLILGDSTTAYCCDKMREMSFAQLSGRVEELCAVRPFFQSVSSSHFSSGFWEKREDDWNWVSTSFLQQMQRSLDAEWRYDYILVVGGWNEESNRSFTKMYLYEQAELLTLTALRLCR